MSTLSQDVRHGIRTLWGSRGFTLAAAISLALGIGANSLVFSILDTIFLRPLSYPDADRLVAILEVELDKPDATWGVSVPTFYDWKEQSRVFDELAVVQMFWPFTVIGGEEPARLQGRRATEGYLRLLGARACEGRLLAPEDFGEGKERVVVLNHGAWQRVFGADPDVVGRTINLDGQLSLVVGVMCPGFAPLWGRQIDTWTQINWRGTNRKGRYFPAIGRLREGVDIATAQAELDVIAGRLAEEYPEQENFGAKVMPLQEYLYGRFGERFFVFFGAVGFVLLIACTNVANLMLVRAANREQEMAIRASLGADRKKLIRKLLTESVLLAFLGSAAGLLLAYGGLKLLVGLGPEFAIPRADEITLNWRILGFTAGIAALTGALFGLYPAIKASQPNLVEALKETGRLPARRFRGGYGREALVVIEVALSLVLLIGAGLMIHNVWRVLRVDIGFNPERLLTLSVEFPRFRYIDVGEETRRLKPEAALALDRIRERLEVVPGVSSVGLTNNGPLWGCSTRIVSVGNQPLPKAGETDEPPWVCYQPISLGYLEMLEVPVVKGRLFEDSNHGGGAPVAIINQTLAREYFPEEEPVGKLLTIGYWDNADTERREIVGVVADIRQAMHRDPYPAMYLPFSQFPSEFRGPQTRQHTVVSFVVRSASDPAKLQETLRRAVAEVAPDIPVIEMQTVDGIRTESTKWSRFYAWLLGAFAAIAILLAAVGVFGVISYSVARRTHEIGIRTALGASSSDVLRLVMRQGAKMTLMGVIVGLAGALALTRFLESQLYEVEPTDPLTFAVASILLAVISLIACLIPAGRAARIRPMAALRHE